MRIAFGILIACLVMFVLRDPVSGEEETKSTAQPLVPKLPSIPVNTLVNTNQIWGFNFHGKIKRGRFLELARPDEKNRTLVITQIEMRFTRSTRIAVVAHRKDPQRKRANGKSVWKKEIRRGGHFSLGYIESTSQYLMAGYGGLIGMAFPPNTRPSLECTLGGGEIAVYAEGYWSTAP